MHPDVPSMIWPRKLSSAGPSASVGVFIHVSYLLVFPLAMCWVLFGIVVISSALSSSNNGIAIFHSVQL